ncbi:unnamed protein product, partial [Mycena citricolor]
APLTCGSGSATTVVDAPMVGFARSKRTTVASGRTSVTSSSASCVCVLCSLHPRSERPRLGVCVTGPPSVDTLVTTSGRASIAKSALHIRRGGSSHLKAIVRWGTGMGVSHNAP